MPSRSRSTMSAKSCPAEKTGPLAARITARMSVVRRQAQECVEQLPHVRFRERVPALGPVHRDGAESGVGGDDDVFVSHGDRLAAV